MTTTRTTTTTFRELLGVILEQFLEAFVAFFGGLLGLHGGLDASWGHLGLHPQRAALILVLLIGGRTIASWGNLRALSGAPPGRSCGCLGNLLGPF